MSKVFNMCGGGGDNGVLWANSIEREDIKNTQAAVTNGTSSNFDWLIPVTMTSPTNTSQYSYLRVGPVDLTGISKINAGMSIAISGNSVSVVLFVSKSDSARSWYQTSVASIASWSGEVRVVGAELNVSELSGTYYVYVGIDSQNTGHAGASTVTVYSLVVS